MRKRKLLIWLAVMAMGIMAGCLGEGAAGDSLAEITEQKETNAPEEILVAVAASLKNVYEEKLIPMFEMQHPGVKVKGIYDSSGKLQVQIEEGLEADVFMPAAKKPMEALEEGGRIASETVVNLLENKIVLIVPSGDEGKMASFEDIRKAEIIALGDPASVPAGQYAREALINLGLWEEIQDRVSLGTNVTEVLNQVAAGSADAGIVYATDAAGMEEQVEMVAEAPKGSLSDRVIYPVAVIEHSTHKKTAESFVEFLKTKEALAVFEEYGFFPFRDSRESYHGQTSSVLR